jgi:cytidylate kinase
MQRQSGFETCLHLVNSETRRAANSPAPFGEAGTHPLAITISRQSGSGAHCVATCLARYLQARTPQEPGLWTVFDKNLVERVLEDHNLPSRLADLMPEDRIPELTDALDELLGVHPPVWTFVQQTAETILRLADRGNAILLGRGAHVITSKLDYMFHVRLVGSLESRIEHIRETRSVGRKEALALIRREDRGRQRYLKKYFGKEIDDPLSYHLVINTDFVTYERAARLIGEAALGLNLATAKAAVGRGCLAKAG